MRAHPFVDDSAAVNDHEDEEDLDDSEEEEWTTKWMESRKKIASRLSNEGTLNFCQCMRHS